MLADAIFVGFVPVRDLEKARDFYAGLLGLRVVEDTPYALVVDAHGVHLRLTPVDELTVQPFTVAGWRVPDIVASATALRERGVEALLFEGMEQDGQGIWSVPGGAGRVLWFHDQDGNTLSLTEAPD